MKLPQLEKAGIGKRFKIFVEIARHPDGMTITDVTKMFSDKTKVQKFAYVKQGVWHHINILRGSGYITTKYEKRNNRVGLVCRATKRGVILVQDEMCRLCQVMNEIAKEM